MSPDDIRARFRLGVAVVATVLLALASGCGRAVDDDPGELRDTARIEGAPMVPWRNPAADVFEWFPGATHSDSEIRILSGLRPELARRLGRPATAEENALYLHRVWRESALLGEVAIRRVKGESGAVEMVVAFEPDGRIHGIRLQRWREPAAVAEVITGPWLKSFDGLTARDLAPTASRSPGIPEGARATALAMEDGVRSLLVLRELAAGPGVVRRPAPEAAAGHFH